MKCIDLRPEIVFNLRNIYYYGAHFWLCDEADKAKQKKKRYKVDLFIFWFLTFKFD